jgi:hypothetical protein
VLELDRVTSGLWQRSHLPRLAPISSPAGLAGDTCYVASALAQRNGGPAAISNLEAPQNKNHTRVGHLGDCLVYGMAGVG